MELNDRTRRIHNAGSVNEEEVDLEMQALPVFSREDYEDKGHVEESEPETGPEPVRAGELDEATKQGLKSLEENIGLDEIQHDSEDTDQEFYEASGQSQSSDRPGSQNPEENLAGWMRVTCRE